MKRIFILVFMLLVVIGFSQEKKVYVIPKYDSTGLLISIATVSGNMVVVGKDVWINQAMFNQLITDLMAYTKNTNELIKLLEKIEKENNIEIRSQ